MKKLIALALALGLAAFIGVREVRAVTAHYKVLDFDVLVYANAHSIDTSDPQWYGLAMTGILEEQISAGWRFMDAQNFNGTYGQRIVFRSVGTGNCP